MQNRRSKRPARPDETRPEEPWFSFLTELDSIVDESADFHCIGGFVVSQCYGLGRETADLDVLTVRPRGAVSRIAELAGKGSPLQRKHCVYVDPVGVANYPDDYETRLIRVFPVWRNIRLWALEPHDLALTKLERSNDRDIRDVLYLAQSGLVQRETLISRFEQEYEPYVTGRTPTWNRSTLQMWIDACWPDQTPPLGN